MQNSFFLRNRPQTERWKDALVILRALINDSRLDIQTVVDTLRMAQVYDPDINDFSMYLRLKGTRRVLRFEELAHDVMVEYVRSEFAIALKPPRTARETVLEL